MYSNNQVLVVEYIFNDKLITNKQEKKKKEQIPIDSASSSTSAVFIFVISFLFFILIDGLPLSCTPSFIIAN